MQIQTSAIDVAITANGTSAGYLTVTSTTGFVPGATCQVYSAAASGVAPVQVLITDITSTTIGCRIIPVSPLTGASLGTGPSYGRSDMSAFTTVNSTRICQDRQGVSVNPAYTAEPLL